MLRSLLLALDATPGTQAVMQLAAAIAQDHPARLVGLGVIDEAGIRSNEPVPLGGAAYKVQKEQALLADAEEKIAHFLTDFESFCRGSKLESETVRRRGNPPIEIELECRLHDLLIISREANLHFETAERDNKTLRHLALNCARPILAVPTELKAKSTGIIVAYDDSLPAARALHMFQLIGLFREETTHVLAIHSDPAQAAAIAERGVKFLETHGRLAKPLAIEWKADPTAVIVEQVQIMNPKMLVMGSYGHRGLKELFFGSTTKHLLIDADCPAPIFLYH